MIQFYINYLLFLRGGRLPRPPDDYIAPGPQTVVLRYEYKDLLFFPENTKILRYYTARVVVDLNLL